MRRSRGSAPLDFILVSVPLVLLSLGVVTFSINGYAANISQDVAIEAAHMAALADVDLNEARRSATHDLSDALGGVFKASLTLSKGETSSGCRAVAVVTVSTVVLGLLGKSVDIKEVASAVCELQE